MNSLFDPRWPAALGWALLHFLWQGALVALGVALLLRVLRRSEPRYLVACGALALCLLLPVATTVREWESLRAPAMVALTAQPQRTEQAASPSHPSFGSPSLRARLEATLRPRLPLIVLLWCSGCALMALRLGSGWLWALRWRRRSNYAPEAWSLRLPELGRRLHLDRRVQLLASTLVDSPMVLGLWRPVILVPAALFTGMAPGLLEALLAHELAHIKRHDYLVNVLQSCVEVLLFYHPAVWWISRQVRTEREILADDLAAKGLGEPRRLALALNALDDLQPLLTLTTPALAARGGHLMNRIQHLLRPTQDPRKTSQLLAWLAPALLAVALLTPLAAAIVQEAKNEAPKLYAPAALVREIDALAEQEGLDPALLRAVAWNESHFNPRATSAIGAKGILQVMPGTALKYGATNLEDPGQVARAGAHYLRQLLDRYQGDLSKALTAYNAGEDAVDSGQLNDENRRYAPAVLALLKSHAVQPDSLSPLQSSTPTGLPVPEGRISAPFGDRSTKGFHEGIDLKGAKGTPVQATAEGTVSFAGPNGDYGITVILQHGAGLETFYAHLAETCVQAGQRVPKGATLGTMGRTGNAMGLHVHYEVRRNGKAIDPAQSPETHPGPMESDQR